MSDPESEPSPAEAPRCTACAELMRLRTVQPAYFYKEFVEVAYVCECGESATTFVPRRETSDQRRA
jgi:hypothetical protein